MGPNSASKQRAAHIAALRAEMDALKAIPADRLEHYQL
jgi:hypothetical protein